MNFRFGTCGFGYSDWAGVFYPRGMKSSEYLAFYSRYFDSVELDTTFHATPEPAVVRRWAAATPETFRFCTKAPSAITHMGNIDEQLPSMFAYLDVIRELGEKLGVVLLQFPPSFTVAQFDRLARFLEKLPADIRFAVEFRHDSWIEDKTTQLLRDARCAWAVGDYGTPPAPVRVTTDFLYVRWIGQHGSFKTYDHEQLDTAERLEWWGKQFAAVPARVQTIWGFFNNDYAGYSIGSCNRMKRILGLDAREPEAIERGELFG